VTTMMQSLGIRTMKIQEIQKRAKDLENKLQKERVYLQENNTFNFFLDEVIEDVKQLNALLEG
jgi:hypothetical protein